MRRVHEVRFAKVLMIAGLIALTVPASVTAGQTDSTNLHAFLTGNGLLKRSLDELAIQE